MKDIDSYAAWAKTTWFGGDGTTERDLTIMSLGLAGETGEVMELLKKRVRDGQIDPNALKKELGDVAYYWAQLCTFFDLKPSDVLAANIEKCEGRRTRGTQQGSGNER